MIMMLKKRKWEKVWGVSMDLLLSFPTPGAKADLSLSQGQLALDDSFYSAVLISLFTDARAEDSDELPGSDTWRRGWWADALPSLTDNKDKTGSRLWLLMRCKATENTRLRAEDYAKEALAWLLQDGLVRGVNVSASWLDKTGGLLQLAISLELFDGSFENYNFLKHLESSHAL